tara:strand:- start:1637 stop:2329 length:693 start_codon:yes stop_codon:yes gene_type:complete
MSSNYTAKVSICTPTYNRRKFIKNLIKYIETQDYPNELIEWVIIDDGEDKIEDLVKNITNVIYVKLPEKVTIGKKRNISHTYCSGSIIIYMDDDDFYPPTRVSHAVFMLNNNPEILCAGCSKTYIYFTDRNETYGFGPYQSYHATANTFAFKRELLEQTKYNDEDKFAEEKEFLKDYSIPMIQLNVLKTILIISHDGNTFDKRQILKYGKKSSNSIIHFINSGFSLKLYE